MFGLHRFKLHRHLADGTVKSGLGRFSVFSGFGLDRFHCSKENKYILQVIFLLPCQVRQNLGIYFVINPNPYTKQQHNLLGFVKLICQWFSPGTPVSSTNKTDHQNIAETLLKVALNTITLTLEKDNALKTSPKTHSTHY